jgi:hypothetical protein
MATNQLPSIPDALISLVERVKETYKMPPSPPPKRGKQRDFSGLSFLLLAVIAVTLRTFRDSELRKLLEKDVRLREALEFKSIPHRTTIGRRLSALVAEAEEQIAALGQALLEEVKPTADQTQTSAIDGRMYQAQGPRWHKQDREQGRRRAYAMLTPSPNGRKAAIVVGCKAIAWFYKAWSFPFLSRFLRRGVRTMSTKRTSHKRL